jgi:DNA invertase Pin-like site-specific DNA recombinase
MRCVDPECLCGCHGRKPPAKIRKPKKIVQATGITRFCPTKEETERIRAEYQSGRTIEALAKENRCGKARISAMVSDLRLQRLEFDVEDAQRLYAQCGSIRTVARKLGVSEGRLQEVLGTKKRNVLTEPEAERIRTLHAQGVSVSEISRQTDRDRWTVYKALGKKKGEHRDPCSSTFGADACQIDHSPHPTVPHHGDWGLDAGRRYRLEWTD